MRTHPLRPSPKLKAGYRVVLIIAIVVFLLRDDASFTSLALPPILFVLLAFFYYYRVVARIKQQPLNEALAYTSLPDKSFFVYLRSFETANRIAIKNTVGDWAERSLVGKYWEIEHALTAALDQEGLLVAIGDKHPSLGAAKVLASDEEWKQRFSDLCYRARSIFVLPDGTNSLRWEMEQVIRNPEFASKTFFLMAPRRSRFVRAFDGGLVGWVLNTVFVSVLEHRARWWKATQAALGKDGLFIPDYKWQGTLFQMNSDGKVTNSYPFDWLRGDMIVKLLERPQVTDAEIQEQKNLIEGRRQWFEKWPITWTISTPGAFLPILISLVVALLIRTFLFNLSTSRRER